MLMYLDYLKNRYIEATFTPPVCEENQNYNLTE